MKRQLVILSFIIPSLSFAQSANMLGSLPAFLVTASIQELEATFLRSSFFRFSTTLQEGIAVAYENTNTKMVGSLGQIVNQINERKNFLWKATEEKPQVEVFEWADFMERIETYPCGLVAVFRNNQLCEIWIDINEVRLKSE